MGLEHVGSARSGLVSEIQPGQKVAVWAARGPAGLLVALGGQKANFWAEKWGRRPLEAIPSGGAVERKVRAVRRDSVAKVSDRFGPPGPLEDDCTGFSGDFTENTGENGPKGAIFGCFLGISPL